MTSAGSERGVVLGLGRAGGAGRLRAHDRLPAAARSRAEPSAAISKRLRKERELAFYGDVDFVPTSAYRREDAARAIEEAGRVVAFAREVVAVSGLRSS